MTQGRLWARRAWSPRSRGGSSGTDVQVRVVGGTAGEGPVGQAWERSQPSPATEDAHVRVCRQTLPAPFPPTAAGHSAGPTPARAAPAHPTVGPWRGHPRTSRGRVCHPPAPLCLGKNANVGSFSPLTRIRRTGSRLVSLREAAGSPSVSTPSPNAHWKTPTCHKCRPRRAPGSRGDAPGAARSLADVRGRGGGRPLTLASRP